MHGKDRTRRPEDVRDGNQSRPGSDGGDDPLRIRLDDHDGRSRHVQRPEEPEVLVGRGDDLVVGLQAEAGEDDVAPVGGRSRDRHLVDVDPDELGELGAQLLARLEQSHELGEGAAPFLETALLRGLHRVDRPACERPDAPGLQIGIAIEHRELGACLLERHVRDSDDSGSTIPVQCASSSPTRLPIRLPTTGR